MPKCKYCGSEKDVHKDICGYCRSRLPLVKELIKMLEPYKEIVEERKRRNAVQNRNELYSIKREIDEWKEGMKNAKEKE